MSAFTVEDQERQRKMNKMTDGKMLKNDTWGCAKDLERSFGHSLLKQKCDLTSANYSGKVSVTQYGS